MSHTNESILVVEDNKDLVNLLEINLSDEGYQVQTAMDGEAALEAFNQQEPSLIVLDVMLPKMDGFDVCKEIRSKNKQVPILMLTAKSEEVDKVLGLEIGADDYMTKPFSIREFLARVKAIIRRSNTASTPAKQSKLSYKDLVVDPDKRRVSLQGEMIELTSKEYDLLLLFFSNPGKAYSREELLNIVWGYSYEGYSHTVNSHINRLRSKIEDDPSEPDYIKTVWGVGYRFTDIEKEANHA
ncbi:response regulator transcription factor [Rhodohalobacter sp. 8-1]|uniref:response regulator transcription factor n=1 Tax=Rhodohalobacter sp. 8-1 TaxID=3131972 RepID=UPI0030EF7F94